MSKPIRRERDASGKLKPHNRCRKWELQVSISKDGKYRKRSKRFQGTYREACDELARFKVSVEGERTSRIKFANYASDYIDRREKAGIVSDRTIEGMRNAVKLATFKDRDITDIDHATLSQWRDALLETHAPSSIPTIFGGISPIFIAAVRDGLILANPAQYVEMPEIIRAERNIPSDDEVTGMLHKLDYRDNHHRAIMLSIMCGMRRGEICALRWEDVDGDVLTIRHGMTTGGKLKVVKGKKTKRVAIPKTLSALLESIRAEDGDYVCSPGGGLPMKPNNLTEWWIDHRDALGMGSYRFHDLRHAYVTALVNEDVHISVMRDMARHEHITTTQTYTHVSMENQRDAAARLDERFAAILRQF